MRLGSVRDAVLARVPIEAHRALSQTCKALRRLVYSDDFAKLRKMLGFEECGLLLLAGRIYEGDDEWAMVDRRKQFVCLTHNLESLGFAAQTDCPLDLDEFTTALSTDGRLIVCGDANYSRKVLVYDTGACVGPRLALSGEPTCRYVRQLHRFPRQHARCSGWRDARP